MTVGEISYLNVLSDLTYPKLSLCRPDYTVIHPLEDIYGLNLTMHMGAINKVDFTIPTMVMRNHRLTKNPLINSIKDRYYLKFEFEGQTEYFLFLERNKQLSNDGTTISYSTYGVGIELADKDIYEYNEDGLILLLHARNLLAETSWEVDYIDPKFNSKRRTFENPSSNVLEALFNLAERYNAVILFNSIDRKVSFYDANNLGLNRGLELREGYLLDSLSVSQNSQEVVTRLKAYGQDGLEFRTLSSSGSNYIEDYSYFMYPFEADVNYNVIKHSDHMSDSLCIALLKYKKKTEDNQGLFSNLVTQRTNKQNEIQQQEQVLSNLNTELKTLEDEQWVINRQFQDLAPNRADWINVTNRLNAKKAQITTNNNALNNLNNQLNGIANQIQNLANSLKIENNFTTAQLKEWNRFILTDEYRNDSIFEEQDLLDETKEVFVDYMSPSINTSVSMEGYIDSIRDKLKPAMISIADIINVNSEELDVNLKLKLIEIRIDFDNSNVEIDIANGKGIVDENAKFKKFIADSSFSSTTLNIEKYSYREGKQAFDGLTEYINSNLDTARQVLIGGYQSTTSLNDRGLFSQDYEDEDAYLVINNGILAVTPDGGNSIAAAITKRGIFAENLYSRIILSNRVHVESTSGVITIEDTTMTIKDNNDKKLVELGTYTNPDNASLIKHGLRIYDGAIDIRTSSSNQRGTQFDSNGIRAFNNTGIRTFDVNANTGRVEIIGDLNIKSTSTSNRGVEITPDGIRGRNASGGITFELNSDTGKSTIQENFTIQTNTQASRGIKIENYGIRGYNPSGNITFEINSVTGSAYFKGDIEASNITGSTIAGGNINVTSDLYVGSNIYMQGSTINRAFYFNDSQNSYIQHRLTVVGSTLNNELRISGGNNGLIRFESPIRFDEDVIFYGNVSGIGSFATERYVDDEIDDLKDRLRRDIDDLYDYIDSRFD